MTWNKEADSAMRSHSNKIITAAGGGAHSTPAGNNTKVKPQGFKAGGRVGFADGGLPGGDDEAMEGEAPAGRLDRPTRGAKKGGATTVNVIIAQKPDQPPASPMMPPPPADAGPPMPPPGAGAPPMGPGGPPPMMGRKAGGRVNYPIDDGAGGAAGRLEKTKAYGLKPAKGK